MQLYVNDYLADTAHLNATQHGNYLKLILEFTEFGKPVQEMPHHSFIEFFQETPEGWVPNARHIKKLRFTKEYPNRLPEHIWSKIRAIIFKRDDFTCQYCGQRGGDLECDHVHPLSKGGSNEASNLVTSCRKCNRQKQNKTLEEWLITK